MLSCSLFNTGKGYNCQIEEYLVVSDLKENKLFLFFFLSNGNIFYTIPQLQCDSLTFLFLLTLTLALRFLLIRVHYTFCQFCLLSRLVVRLSVR